ncbi:MAG: helix-turn-helix transcriptional regulator [Proteobacteria bacterium]|nr:helix-turn-helix transcriptional regulator [Pseudomonadota bacterium]
MNSMDAVEALSALAQETRLAVFRLLVRESGERVAGGAGGEGYSEGLCAGVIAERLEVPPATLSFHLAKLEHAGLIKAQRKSLNIFYSADHPGIRSLLGFLIEDCCRGRPELCGVRLPERFHEPSPEISP